MPLNKKTPKKPNITHLFAHLNGLTYYEVRVTIWNELEQFFLPTIIAIVSTQLNVSITAI